MTTSAFATALLPDIYELEETLALLKENKELQENYNRAGDLLVQCVNLGKRIYLCGNGGSAADAQHIAAEFVGRFEGERRPLAAIALTTDTSALTAIGNDYGYEEVFARQISGLGQHGDVLIAISTSGNSQNVLKAVMAAKAKGIHVIGLTGHGGGAMRNHTDILLNIEAKRTSKIQECHILLMHSLCKFVDNSISA